MYMDIPLVYGNTITIRSKKIFNNKFYDSYMYYFIYSIYEIYDVCYKLATSNFKKIHTTIQNNNSNIL